MSEESINLEETNRIRKSLGLSLIPIPGPTSESKTPSEERESKSSPPNDISLEETNRIRISLGQKPIPIPNTRQESITDNKEGIARENWLKKIEIERKASQQDRIRKKIQESKERAERRRALDGGRSLGEDEDNNSQTNSADGTKSWIAKFRVKQQQLQQKRLQNDDDNNEEEEKQERFNNKVDKQEPAPSYSSKDLGGLRVGHKLDQIQNLNQDTVLILKDSDVLGDDESELISNSLVEQEKLEENKMLQKGKKYDEYDEDDNGQKKKSVLSKYDQDEDNNFFILDGSESLPNKQINEKEPLAEHNTGTTTTSRLENMILDFNEIGSNISQPSSDYQESRPAKFKKPKKLKDQKAQNSNIDRKRKRLYEEEEKYDNRNEPVLITPPIDDDEDLQAILALNRRRVQKSTIKRKRLAPEELAEKVLAEVEQERMAAQEEEDANKNTRDDDDGKRIVVSNTTDFLALVRQNSVEPEKSEERDEHIDKSADESIVEDVTMADDIIESNVNNDSIAIEASSIAPEEPTLNGGIADVLRLLQSKGAIKKKSEEDIEKERAVKQQREWIRQAEKDRLIRELESQRQREADRVEGKYDRLSQKDREEIAQHENRIREAEEAQAAQKRFANYKPDIKIEYRDDMGNTLTTKEAFKHMSRQFHGNSAGKKRVEKQISKLDEQRQKEAESLFQVSSNEGSMKKTKAGVRLQ